MQAIGGADPGDEPILRRALSEGRVLITLDKDFGTLAVVARKAHSGIVRMRQTRTKDLVTVCLRALAFFSEELAAGAFVVATPKRIRARPRDD